MSGRAGTSHRRLAWLGAAAAFILGTRVPAAPPTDQPPVPGAVRVLTVGPDDTTGAAGAIGGVGQPWLSDHEVLHFRHGLLYRYDATARTDAPLTLLTRQVKSSHCFIYFLEASPDGQRVIWGMSANNPLFAASDDRGTEHCRYAAFRSVLAGRAALSDGEVDRYVALAELDPDVTMAGPPWPT